MKNDSFFLDLGACSNTVRKSNVTPPCTYSTVFIFKDKRKSFLKQDMCVVLRIQTVKDS